MNVNGFQTAIFTMVVFAGSALAQDPWDPAATPMQSDSAVTAAKDSSVQQGSVQGSLPEMKDRLETTYRSHAGRSSSRTADLYFKTAGKFAEWQALQQKRPDARETSETRMVCSLTIAAALLQLAADENRFAAAAADAQKDSLLLELNNLHETINGIERSHASKLKDDLDEERRKARALQEEAERKFSELQSELISVSKDARGTIISMSDILFDVGKAGLTPSLKTSLAKIAGILMVYKGPSIVVEGHTDNVGSEEYNQKLSEERAGNVKQFLVEQGVGANRLTSNGYSFHKPIAENTTKEGRQKNRRVDLVIQDNRIR